MEGRRSNLTIFLPVILINYLYTKERFLSISRFESCISYFFGTFKVETKARRNFENSLKGIYKFSLKILFSLKLIDYILKKGLLTSVESTDERKLFQL